MIRLPDRRVLISTAALSVAGIVFIAVFARAITVDEPPIVEDPATDTQAQAEPATTDPPTTPQQAPPQVEPGQAEIPTGADRPLTEEALLLAAEQDPFQQNRRRPDAYQLPSEWEPPRRAEPEEERELPEPPEFRVLGTVVMGDGNGYAVLEVDDVTRILQKGESVQGFRLERVLPDAVTMQSSYQSLSLAVMGPEPRTEQRRGRRGENNNDRRRGGGEEEQLQQLEELGVRLNAETLERLRAARGGRAGRGGRGRGGDLSFSTDALWVPASAAGYVTTADVHIQGDHVVRGIVIRRQGGGS